MVVQLTSICRGKQAAGGQKLGVFEDKNLGTKGEISSGGESDIIS